MPRASRLSLTGWFAGARLMGMQLQFTNPELEAKVEQWVSETGRPAEELVEDAMAGYFEELAEVRNTLNSRYEDIKSGKVTLMDGDEAFSRLRAKSEAWRKSHL